MGFFSRSSEETLQPVKPRELGTDWVVDGVIYEPGLVDRLKQEHQELERLYTAIKAAATTGQFQKISRLLIGLKLVLQKHVMLENVKFYAYLEQNCDSATYRLVSELRLEMDDIARMVARFVNTHTVQVPTSGTADRFRAELEDVGNVLFSRVRMEEEHLYTAYQPNY